MFTSSMNASAQAPLANNTFSNSVIQICPLVLDASFQFADIRDLSTIDLLLKHTPWHPCGIWKRVFRLSVRQCLITSCQRHSSTAGARVARFCRFVPPTLWPPNSSDLNPVDYSVWSVKMMRLTTRLTIFERQQLPVVFVANQRFIKMYICWWLNLTLRISQDSASTYFRWSGHFMYCFVKCLFLDMSTNFYWNRFIFDRHRAKDMLAQFF